MRIIFRVYSMPHWPVGRVSTVCVLQYLNPFIWGGDRPYIIHHPLGVANITPHTPERNREEGKIDIKKRGREKEKDLKGQCHEVFCFWFFS